MAIFIPAIVTLFSLSLQSSSQGEKFTQAYALAQKGMEDIFYQKADSAWSGWVATSNTSTALPPFTREIEIADACRDSGDNLHECPSNKIDNETRKIIVTVSWIERDPLNPQEVKLEAYVTKH